MTSFALNSASSFYSSASRVSASRARFVPRSTPTKVRGSIRQDLHCGHREPSHSLAQERQTGHWQQRVA